MFDKQWFLNNQKLLRWFANTKYGKDLLGHGLERVDLILPNAVFKKEGKIYTAEFRTHDKYAKRLFYEFQSVWKAFHWFDMNVANIYVPKLNLGFDTLTAYPDANVETSTVDGYALRGSVDQTFTDIRAGAGTSASDTGTNSDDLFLVASTTSNQYQTLIRAFYLFDTSTLTSEATINSAVVSTYGTAANTKANAIGSPDFHLGSSTPASNTAIAASDFANRGTTSFGSIAYASFTGSQYNDLTLNASGIANISKTGVSKFSGQLSWDILNDTTGLSWVSASSSGFRMTFADTADTTSDPKLVVTYTIPIGGAFTYFM